MPICVFAPILSAAVFRIRHALAFAIHKFFNDRGFCYLHTPIITASDAEGAGEMFRVTTLPLENPPRTDNGEIDFGRTFSAGAPTSPFPGSWKASWAPWPSAMCTPSALRSALKTPTPRATWPNSG
jgi:hypothetical protein